MDSTLATDPMSFASLLNMMLGLVVVVAFIFAASWVLRRMQPGRPEGRQQLTVVSSLSLGPKDRLLVVRAGEEELLIGVSAAGGIQPLHTLSRADEGAAPVEIPQDPSTLRRAATSSTDTAKTSGFARHLELLNRVRA